LGHLLFSQYFAAEADNKFWPALLELFRPREQQELVIRLSQKSAYNRMAFLR
jgi:hypothetical protein